MTEHSPWKLEFGLYKGNTWANIKCTVGQDSLMANICSNVEESFVCSMWQPSVKCWVFQACKRPHKVQCLTFSSNAGGEGLGKIIELEIVTLQMPVSAFLDVAFYFVLLIKRCHSSCYWCSQICLLTSTHYSLCKSLLTSRVLLASEGGGFHHRSVVV